MNKHDIMNMTPGNDMNMVVERKIIKILEQNQNEVKNYSSNMADAWVVIQKMMDKNYQYNISFSDNKHTCVLDNLFTHRRFIIHSSSPMESICKAALLAALEEEKEERPASEK